jgi:plastocyanin
MHPARIVFAATVVALSACGSGEAGGGSETPTQVVELAATDFAFRADARITIEAGDTVEFIVRNEGAVDHEMEVLTDASRRLGTTERIAPGSSDTVVVTFDQPGTYLVICDIDNHRSLGQQAEFEVIGVASEEG